MDGLGRGRPGDTTACRTTQVLGAKPGRVPAFAPARKPPSFPARGGACGLEPPRRAGEDPRPACPGHRGRASGRAGSRPALDPAETPRRPVVEQQRGGNRPGPGPAGPPGNRPRPARTWDPARFAGTPVTAGPWRARVRDSKPGTRQGGSPWGSVGPLGPGTPRSQRGNLTIPGARFPWTTFGRKRNPGSPLVSWAELIRRPRNRGPVPSPGPKTALVGPRSDLAVRPCFLRTETRRKPPGPDCRISIMAQWRGGPPQQGRRIGLVGPRVTARYGEKGPPFLRFTRHTRPPEGFFDPPCSPLSPGGPARPAGGPTRAGRS